MPYIKTIWVNDKTKLNADNLNHIEEGIEQAQNTADEKSIVIANPENEAEEQLTKIEINGVVYDTTQSPASINGNELIGNKTGDELGLVNQETGKGLSTNDFTDYFKALVQSAIQDNNYVHTDNNFTDSYIAQIVANTAKVSNVQADWNATSGLAVILNKPTSLGNVDDVLLNDVSVVTNKIARIVVNKTTIGLSNVDNTSDLNKPISNATQNALDALDDKLDENVQVKPTNNKISYNGDTVTLNENYVNLQTGNASQKSEVISLANGTTAGMMSPSDYNAIRNNASRIEALEGQIRRLLYTDKANPTSQEIAAFVTSQGYTENLESIAVVVSETYHIWHYYTNDGWKDDGVDAVNTFTNQTAGIIKGSSNDGQVFAENDGTGSVYGWSDLKNRVSNIESKDTNYDTHINNGNIHVTSADKQTWNGKQDVISDLTTIRNGASKGATSLQPGDLDDYTTKNYVDNLVATKQDVINDLDDIRDGAEKGASAVQQSDLVNYVQDANYEHIDKSDVTANTLARHTHNNKSILDGIASDNLVSASDRTTWNNKQDTLVNQTNIKSINGQSILGSGDLQVGGGGIDREETLPQASASSPDFVGIGSVLYFKAEIEWDEPIQTGDELEIRQAYTITQVSDTLNIE